MNNVAPNYFIQTNDLKLHAYYDRSVLLCDLSINGGDGVTVLALKSGGLTLVYEPTTIDEIRGES